MSAALAVAGRVEIGVERPPIGASMASDKIFVTGATGRLGLPLVRHLVAAGHDVVGLARSEAGAKAVQRAGATVVRGDLSDSDALTEGLKGARFVYHLAGGVRGPGSATPAVLNQQGTESLLAALAGVGADDLACLVLASSCAVYGDRSSLWVEEDFKTSPNTDYGKSKVAAEKAVIASAETLGFRAAIARIAAVYGHGFSFPMAERMTQKKGYLPGEGRNHIPVVHVDDCVAALERLAESGDGIYHVADQSTPTTREFYDKVHSLVGGKPMVFWSTWVPSYVQLAVARQNERIQSRMDRKPRFTPDNWRLYTNSVRLKTQKLEKGLNFEWRYPTYEEGLSAVYGG
jgi:nucleoside-diphosphate-sugar epimerase